MALKFTPESRAAWTRRLRAVAPTAEKHLRDANRKTASDIVKMAQRLVEVDDGTLRDSIRMESGEREATAFIARAGGPATTKPVRDGHDASFDYATALEWGTSQQPAEPFFYPSVRAHQRIGNRRQKAALKKAMQETGRG